MANRKQPEIRFTGFTDDWEERKLGELGEVTTGKAFSSTDFDNQGEYLVITNKDISDSSRSQNVVTNRISISDNETIQRYNLSGKNILVTMDGVNLGKSAKFSNSKALLAQRVGRIKSNQLEFIYQITSSNTFLSKMRTLSVGNAIKHISLKQISDFSSLVPKDTTEQKKIGAFFKQLDDTIALHQRNLELLKEQKKGFLQKMFPKAGANTPEVRFAGFIAGWEQCKLGEVADFSKGNGYTKNDLVESGDPIILYGRLYTKYETVIENVDTFVSKKDKSILSEGYEVIVPASGETSEDISRAAVVGKPGLILGGDLNIIKPVNYIDSVFLALTISNGSQQKEMSKRAQGKSVVHLHNSDLKQINLLYPKLEEQQKIGTFFKQLDNTIALHQRELDLLKETKKGFLQKMFV